MNVRPLHDRIIVSRIEEGEQKIGGIIIPDSAKEKPQQGKVIAAGNGKSKDDGKRIPLDVKAGDLILFGKYSGQEIKLDGEEFLIMREDEVLAVIEDGDTKKEEVGDGDIDGKTDCVRRAVAPGDPARRQPAGRRGKGHARPEGPQRRPRQEIRIADHHQGRRDGGEGNRPQGPAREHGRADGPRSREQDLGHGGRRHHHRHRARPGDLPRRREERRRRREPDGHQARHREGGRGAHRRDQDDVEAGQRQHGRPGRHHLREQRRDDRQDHRRRDGQGRQGRRHHRRRSAHARDLARSRRRHAVRPRLPVALLRDRSRADGSRAREPGHPDPREEDQLDEGSPAGARAGGAPRPAAAHHRGGHRRRGARDARRQQAARHAAGRRRQGAGLRRSPQGDARGHRDPDQRPRDHRGSRDQARDRSRSTTSARPRRSPSTRTTRRSSKAAATPKPSRAA